MPEVVEVYEAYDGWKIGYFSDSYNGWDNATFVGLTIRINNVTHCPFCGERLVE